MSRFIPRGSHEVDELDDGPLDILEQLRREKPRYCECGPAHIPDRLYIGWWACRRCGHLRVAVTED